MQWGYAQKPTSEYDFYWVYPIPFPTLVGAIMLTPQYEGQCRVHSINSFDRFSCSFRTDGTRTDLNSNHVFAIGFQQWGVGAPYSDGYSVTTLPIPFSNTDYTVIANSSWLNSGAVMASAALSVTQIKVRNGGYTDTYHFLTIGRQQWGIITCTTGREGEFIFPISFTTKCLSFIASASIPASYCTITTAKFIAHDMNYGVDYKADAFGLFKGI